MIGRAEEDQILGLLPADLVDADLQGGFGAQRRGRGQVGERRPAQGEGLEDGAAVAAAEHLLAALAVGRPDHVAEDLHRVALVGVGERLGELDGRADGVARAGHLEYPGQHHRLADPDADGASQVGAFAGDDQRAARLQAVVEGVQLDLGAGDVVGPRAPWPMTTSSDLSGVAQGDGRPGQLAPA